MPNTIQGISISLNKRALQKQAAATREAAQLSPRPQVIAGASVAFPKKTAPVVEGLSATHDVQLPEVTKPDVAVVEVACGSAPQLESVGKKAVPVIESPAAAGSTAALPDAVSTVPSNLHGLMKGLALKNAPEAGASKQNDGVVGEVVEKTPSETK